MFKFHAACFVRTDELPLVERQPFEQAIRLMALLWRAGIETQTFDLEEVRSRGRCLLLATALLEAMVAAGWRDASFLRCGVSVTKRRDGRIISVSTVGHPAAPPDTQLWNAHMVVRWRDLIFDPSYAQMLGRDEAPLHFAVFKRMARLPFELHQFGEVEAIASGIWRTGETESITRLFHLPRPLDLATRKWRARPDAQPLRRAALVRRTLELLAFEQPTRTSHQAEKRGRNRSQDHPNRDGAFDRHRLPDLPATI